MDIKQPDEKDAFNAAIAMVLKLRRTERNMTIGAVAAASGLKEQAVQSYLSGERPILVGNLMVLARALKLDPAQVMTAAEARLAKSSDQSIL